MHDSLSILRKTLLLIAACASLCTICHADGQRTISAQQYSTQLITRMVKLHNHDEVDSMQQLMPSTLNYMSRHALWDDYYYTWSLLPSRYAFINKSGLALKEAKAMYADAKQRDNTVGIGVAQFCRGLGNYTLERYEEAEGDLRASLQTMKFHKQIYAFHHAYLFLCYTLLAQAKYEELYNTTLEWQQRVNEYVTRYNVPTKRARELTVTCLVHTVMALNKLGDYTAAAPLIQRIDSMSQGRSPRGLIDLYIAKSFFLSGTKQYDKAIYIERQGMKLTQEQGDMLAYVELARGLARDLYNAGRYKEAADAHAKLMPIYNKTVTNKIRSNLAEYNDMYDVTMLTSQSHASYRLLFAAILLVVFIFASIIYFIIFNRHLRAKNKRLFDAVNRMREAEQHADEQAVSIDDENLDSRHKLYQQLVRLMQDEHLFTEPNINRDVLARRVGTNRTYIADAIKTCAGVSVSEFINRFRLNYSAELLRSQPKMSIADVSAAAGFATHSTFNRAFHDAYSLTPTEYRNMAAQKLEEQL